jgi:Flp pilus assembly protein TadG
VAWLKAAAARVEDDRGAELVEFALLLPVLLFVMAMMVEFGFLFQRYEVITNAAREGARMAALPEYMAAAPAPDLGTDVKSHVKDYLSKGAPGAGLDTICGITGGYQTNAGVGPVVTVTLSCTLPSLVLSNFARMVGGTAASEVTLVTSSVMRAEYGGS